MKIISSASCSLTPSAATKSDAYTRWSSPSCVSFVLIGESWLPVGEAVEGSQTVFCGFISPTFSRLSVDEGIIKSLAGPNDDLTGFTISASIGPYATGGPLLDANNRVIGIAMPTDTTGVSPTHTAVKADLLASLLRVSDIRLSEPPETEDEPLDVALSAQMARSAVVLVEAK